MAAIPKLLRSCGSDCECRLGFLALDRWCRQLAVYCLDVAVITVASLVRVTCIAAVPTGAISRHIAYLKGGLWTCRSLSVYRAARH